MFPNQAHPEPYNFGAPDDHDWFINEILGHHWEKGARLKNLKFEVCWSLGNTTWEPYKTCKDLEALNRYLELHGSTTIASQEKVDLQWA